MFDPDSLVRSLMGSILIEVARVEHEASRHRLPVEKARSQISRSYHCITVKATPNVFETIAAHPFAFAVIATYSPFFLSARQLSLFFYPPNSRLFRVVLEAGSTLYCSEFF